MNKYLLLRDNKQSGPYTVSEIIELGIKPYDLVWLEGKSAAWRYPSEVEELKAYAPAVEEQPFDRFYKKPEQKKDLQKSTSHTVHSKFEPKTGLPETPAEQTSQKVYVNFPGGSQDLKQQKPSLKEEKDSASETKRFIPPVYSESPVSTISAEKNAQLLSEVNRTSDNVPSKKNDKKFLYAAVAACFILMAFISVLLINYINQRENLKQLNSIVQQIESREKQQQQPAPATMIIKDLLPEPPAETNALIPGDIISEQNIPAEKNLPSKKQPPVTRDRANTAGTGVIFTETIPEEQIHDVKQDDEKKIASSSENLYKLVSIKSNNYKTGLLGGISNLKIELTNSSLRELHKVAVEIKYFGPEKKIVRKQTVYFENVSPGAQTTIDVPKSNRGVSIDYIITDIKS